jgi:hypothetical protein
MKNPKRYVRVRRSDLEKLRAVLRAARLFDDPKRHGYMDYMSTRWRPPTPNTLISREILGPLLDAVEQAKGIAI